MSGLVGKEGLLELTKRLHLFLRAGPDSGGRVWEDFARLLCEITVGVASRNVHSNLCYLHKMQGLQEDLEGGRSNKL